MQKPIVVTGNLIRLLQQRKKPEVGSSYVECLRSFSLKDTQVFAQLTGDDNPIHLDDIAAKSLGHPSPLVHGLLVSSVFPTFFGASLPGSLYVSQSLEFKLPIYIDENVRIRLDLLSKKRNLIECQSSVYKSNEKIAISGVSRVWLPKL